MRQLRIVGALFVTLVAMASSVGAAEAKVLTLDSGSLTPLPSGEKFLSSGYAVFEFGTYFIQCEDGGFLGSVTTNKRAVDTLNLTQSRGSWRGLGQYGEPVCEDIEDGNLIGQAEVVVGTEFWAMSVGANGKAKLKPTSASPTDMEFDIFVPNAATGSACYYYAKALKGSNNATPVDEDHPFGDRLEVRFDHQALKRQYFSPKTCPAKISMTMVFDDALAHVSYLEEHI